MDFQTARHNMIEQQIRTWEVLDPTVLDLLSQVHREEFIPEKYQNLALADARIPIGHGQTTLTPKSEARILQAVQIKPDEQILEVGTGCGYFTALLASSGQHVTSIEIFEELSDSASKKLSEHGYQNVTIIHDDIFQSLPSQSSYDVITLTGSMWHENPAFKNALKIGGRLFQIIGQSPVMEAVLLTRISEDAWHMESLFETDIAALIGAEKKTEFQL